MLTWLLILFYFASSKHERVVFEYVREDIGEVAVGDIDPNLEEAEPTLVNKFFIFRSFLQP